MDGSIRPQHYDFVAGRFMAKRDLGGGRIAWLEAGWAETGWAGPGRQHVYTFNTNTKTWQFYDQYAMRPGDQVWLDLHSDADGVWGAWLWWNNRWNLLTAQQLPIGASAYRRAVRRGARRRRPADPDRRAAGDGGQRAAAAARRRAGPVLARRRAHADRRRPRRPARTAASA